MFGFACPPFPASLSHPFPLLDGPCSQPFLAAFLSCPFPICLGAQKAARATDATALRPDSRIGTVVRMPAITRVATQVSGRQCVAAKRIRPRRNCLKMVRSDAAAITTEMIDLKSRGNSAIDQFVREPVSLYRLRSAAVDGAVTL